METTRPHMRTFDTAKESLDSILSLKVEGTCFAMILIFDEKYGKMRYTFVLLMMVGNVQILIQGHETKNDLFKKR